LGKSVPVSFGDVPVLKFAPSKLPSNGCASSLKNPLQPLDFEGHVQDMQRYGRAIGLGDLIHIHGRLKACRGQRGRLYNWSLGQLRRFVADKARLASAPVLYVDRAKPRPCPKIHHPWLPVKLNK
jgi:hypothetical protein